MAADGIVRARDMPGWYGGSSVLYILVLIITLVVKAVTSAWRTLAGVLARSPTRMEAQESDGG